MEVSNKDQVRISDTLRHVPVDVQSALEIGFSDGRMSDRLREMGLQLYGLDLPRAIVDGETQARVFGTVARLPFSDRAIDLALCCEVLEHLPDEVFRRALAELARVAERYILITVPNQQRLANELTLCNACGFIGHYSSHLRSFDVESLRLLFPDWEPITLVPFGPSTAGYAPDWLYGIRFRFGGYLTRPWPCDRCGTVTQQRNISVLGKVAQSISWRWEQRRPTRPSWLLGLFRRNI